MKKSQKRTRTKFILSIVSVSFLFSLTTTSVLAQAIDSLVVNEWKSLIDQSAVLYRSGDYDSSMVVARKALDFAEKNQRTPIIISKDSENFYGVIQK